MFSFLGLLPLIGSEEEGFSYAIVWRFCGLSKHNAQRVNGKPVTCLTCVALEGHGEFAKAMAGWELTAAGATTEKEGELMEGESLPWKCANSKKDDKVEHFASLQSSTDPRKALAKEHEVRGAFAIFRDGAVYEFGGSKPMEEQPEKLISGIGGSTGVRAAAKVCHEHNALGPFRAHTRIAATSSNERVSVDGIDSCAGGDSGGSSRPDGQSVEGCRGQCAYRRGQVRMKAAIPRHCAAAKCRRPDSPPRLVALAFTCISRVCGWRNGARSRYALGPVGHSGIAYGRRYPDAVRSERRRARRHGAAGGAGRRSGAAREKRIRRHGRALSVSPAERKDLQKSGFITL